MNHKLRWVTFIYLIYMYNFFNLLSILFEKVFFSVDFISLLLKFAFLHAYFNSYNHKRIVLHVFHSGRRCQRCGLSEVERLKVVKIIFENNFYNLKINLKLDRLNHKCLKRLVFHFYTSVFHNIQIRMVGCNIWLCLMIRGLCFFYYVFSNISGKLIQRTFQNL